MVQIFLPSAQCILFSVLFQRFIQDDTFHIQSCDLFHDAKLPCRTHAQGSHDIFLQDLDLLFF